MKSNFIYFIISIALVSGCKKYLEVQPQDKYTEGQVYSNEYAIQQALNGIYDNMASENLYGANLTTTTIEFLGQRYNTASYNGLTGFQYFQQYNYTQTTSQDIINTIWTSAYSNILQANQFIQQIDIAAKNGAISSDHASELKGEAVGLRAFMHFDMLRMFGPVMKTSPTAVAIPYYRNADGATQPILTATQVVDSVLADLTTAMTLLSADPVITNGPDTASYDFYAGNRNQRFNYYAAIAMQARVYLYEGDSIDANVTAKAALTAVDKAFPWMSYADIVNNANPDRIFSPEVLFGVYDQNMYIDYNLYFAPTLTSAQILTAYPARLTAVFESNQNDYRYPTTWITGANGQTFYKYADLADATKQWRFFLPLIRKSELYYILAETEPVAANGINYLNTVRNNRGLTNLAATAARTTEIQKEYQKEFWGEGQVFYYYKRNNLASVPSALNGTGTVTPNYVVPLPLTETTPR